MEVTLSVEGGGSERCESLLERESGIMLYLVPILHPSMSPTVVDNNQRPIDASDHVDFSPGQASTI